MTDLTLIGFRYSVYTRIARLGLIETGLSASYVEVDPFADTPDPALARHTPFGRVPVLRHGDVTLTETAAILRYLAAVGEGAYLVPNDPKAAARMAQVMGVVDAYGYWPMVRQVFSHGFYQPAMGEAADPEEISHGLAGAAPVLTLLEEIAAEGRVLGGGQITLADLHLAPMVDCFVRVPDGAAALAAHPRLSRWWEGVADRPSLRATDPFADGA